MLASRPALPALLLTLLAASPALAGATCVLTTCDAPGALRWEAVVDLPDRHVFGADVAAAADCGAYLAGTAPWGEPPYSAIFLERYTCDGASAGRTWFDGPVIDEAFAVAAQPAVSFLKGKAFTLPYEDVWVVGRSSSFHSNTYMQALLVRFEDAAAEACHAAVGTSMNSIYVSVAPLPPPGPFVDALSGGAVAAGVVDDRGTVTRFARDCTPLWSLDLGPDHLTGGVSAADRLGTLEVYTTSNVHNGVDFDFELSKYECSQPCTGGPPAHVWTMVCCGPGEQLGSRVAALPDGGGVFVGGGDAGALLRLVSSTGQLLWEREGDFNGPVVDVAVRADAGAYMVGVRDVNYDSYRAFVAAVSHTGDLEWSDAWGHASPGTEPALGVASAANGDALVAGYRWAGPGDLYRGVLRRYCG